MATYAMPDFWLGMLLLVTLGVVARAVPDRRDRWTRPPTRADSAKLVDQAHHMFLPALTLTLAYLGEYALVMRSSLLDTMREDYLDARAGEGPARHRRAQPPRGAERAAAGRDADRDQLRVRALRRDRGRDDLLVARPRPGHLRALQGPDLPMLQGLFLVFSAAVIFFNLVADLLYGVPRSAGAHGDERASPSAARARRITWLRAPARGRQAWRDYRAPPPGMIGLGDPGRSSSRWRSPRRCSPTRPSCRRSTPPPTRRGRSPSEFRPLGTDNLGRSVWTQFVWGARISLLVGLAATSLAIVIGSVVGIVAGFYGGRIERRPDAAHRVVPRDPVPPARDRARGDARAARSGTSSSSSGSRPGRHGAARPRAGADAQGAAVRRAQPRARRVELAPRCGRHILPNVSPLILANLTLTVPIAILSETTLAFLGLGDPTRASWGKMLDEAFAAGALTATRGGTTCRRASAIMLVVLAFTLVGQALEEILDPRLRERRAMSDDPRPRAPLLSVRDLHVTYVTAPAACRPSRRRFDLGAGETLGLAGESGCGKSTIAGALLRAAAARHRGRRRGAAGRRGRAHDEAGAAARRALDRASRSCSRARCTRSTPCSASARQIGEAIRLHARDARRRDGGARRRAAGAGRAPGAARGGLPAPALGRPAPARPDRARAGLRPAAADRRRADDRARRDGAGAGAASCSSELQRELGLAMLFITHDLSMLADVCERIAVMYAGRIVEEGPSDERVRRARAPVHARARGAFPVIGDHALPEGAVRGSRGDPPDPRELPARVPVPPPLRRGAARCADAPTSSCGRPGTGPPRGVRRTCRSAAESPPDERRRCSSVAGSTSRSRARHGRRARGRRRRPRRCAPGEVLALVGESGCGKTTLARTILGLERPAAGEVRFEGEPLATTAAACARYRRKVQMVFQDPTGALNPRQTIYEAVAEGAAHPGACPATRRLRVARGARACRAAAARAVLRPLPATRSRAASASAS